MKTAFLLFWVAILVSVHGALPSQQAAAAVNETRIALVIGNSKYKTSPLRNPGNDARLMARTLRGLGFEVIERIDASQKTMKRALTTFSRKLSKAGENAVGLFYYAGHGVQVAGRNYLIPVDANIELEGDVDIESIDANSVLRAMDQARARVNFVILDACRNNPFARSFRSGTRGLAQMDAPGGTLIAYATSPGDVAVDGDGVNSPYTAALTKSMQQPGVPAVLMFQDVRVAVQEATNDRQTTWEASSLTGNFSFKPGAPEKKKEKKEIITEKTTPKPGPGPAFLPRGSDREVVFWNSVKDSSDPADLQAYLNTYPSGTFSELAKIRRDRAKKRRQQAALDVQKRERAAQDRWRREQTARKREQAELERRRKELAALEVQRKEREAQERRRKSQADRDRRRREQAARDRYKREQAARERRRKEQAERERFSKEAERLANLFQPKTPTRKKRKWGAVAVGSGTALGWSWNYGTSTLAANRALAECRKRGKNCKIRNRFYGCYALAQSRYAWGQAGDLRSLSRARGKAMTNCLKYDRRRSSCRITAALCADGSHRR